MPKGTAKQTTTKGGPKKNGVKSASTTPALPKFVFRHLKPSRKIGQGGVLPKTSALGRLMRWPKYVKLQRQRKILLQRLKIPPSINIFTQYAPKALAKSLVRLFAKYRPETRKQKRDRLRAIGKLQADNKPVPSEKKFLVKCGFNHVTNLIENGKAKLVLIAHDVDPIEIVLWMPVLCVKKNIPFCIFRSKARLGTLVNKKTAAVVCLTDVNPEDQETLRQLADQTKQKYNDQLDKLRRKWGARTLGIKTRHRIEKRKRIRKEEAAKRKSAQNKDENDQKK